MTAPHGFSEADIRTLRAHGIALFAGRVIFDAQPPMAEDAIAAVQAHCAGPLPPALLALWRQTAGGRLDYHLSLEVDTSEGPRIEAVAWCELFYDGSRFYRDLQGWIENEQEQAWEAAEDAGEEWNGKLAYLPIGGFEYCDRIYAVTSPGAPDDGGVLAWKMGLPPAWAPALTEDAVTTFAPSLPAAFARLALHDDPLAPGDGYRAGSELLAYLDTCRGNGLPAPLADALLAHYRRALIDWRALLQAGTLPAHPYALRIALCHAVEQDDAALLRHIHASGARLDGLVAGGSNALQHARFLQKTSAIAALEGWI
ncbi:hypothetical protein [Stenotrophomonas nitritireducens]|uniref:hypothetical protein n=1 Tax=Stenotrophomonas nitritireducens TaxID=83617 RepID=UPI003D95D292